MARPGHKNPTPAELDVLALKMYSLRTKSILEVKGLKLKEKIVAILEGI
ncbi:MAG: hypothetical protein ACYS9Y_00610 [Planctomycetota bacterium]|jgi:hypothetical protein